jgi:hypothetical protein
MAQASSSSSLGQAKSGDDDASRSSWSMALSSPLSAEPITMTFSTVFSAGWTFSHTGRSDASTNTTRSSAWLAIHAIWSGCNRMFSVCRTAPIHGTPKYSSRCRHVFQANDPTRSPGRIPRSVRAEASRPTRSPNSS